MKEPEPAPAAALAQRLARVRLLLLDVDGVLTDGRLHYGPGGDESRDFHVRDGTALKLLQEAGIPVGLISGRKTAATERWARDIGLAEIQQGQRDKLPAWRDILARRGLADADAAYMGDDVLDLPLLARAGLAAAPADACPEVAGIVQWRATRRGGEGCVRELVEAILRARGEWDDIIRTRFLEGPTAPAPLTGARSDNRERGTMGRRR